MIPYTSQKLEFIHHELACSRSDQAKVVFLQMQKLKLSISKIKSGMLKKSTVFNFLYIFQLFQKVLTSNFLNLVLNIHIWLYKDSKILFLLEKKIFQVKISKKKSLKHPKVRPFLEYLSQPVPKVPEIKFTRLTWIFQKSSQLPCLLMSLWDLKNASLCSRWGPSVSGIITQIFHKTLPCNP